uniref:Ovule protein n=1 Tax=Heterorhabditis bacteriophora TaxID=37862 RepID=A0A1I7WY10_HETBA
MNCIFFDIVIQIFLVQSLHSLQACKFLLMLPLIGTMPILTYKVIIPWLIICILIMS